MAPRNLRRRLQHHGALGEIERADDVDRVGIGGQPQRLGIHQLGVDDDLVVLDADALQALADRVDADALKGVGERALRVREVDVVVDLVQVALLGAPSLKSSVPMRVSTLSGVAIDGGISAADSGTSAPTARPRTVMISFVFMFFPRLIVCYLRTTSGGSHLPGTGAGTSAAVFGIGTCQDGPIGGGDGARAGEQQDDDGF